MEICCFDTGIPQKKAEENKNVVPVTLKTQHKVTFPISMILMHLVSVVQHSGHKGRAPMPWWHFCFNMSTDKYISAYGRSIKKTIYCWRGSSRGWSSRLEF